MGGDGFEQRYLFDAEPRGEGALVIRLGVSGLRFAHADSEGHHFIDDRSRMGLRYGAATWIDAQGRKTGLEVGFRSGSLELVVPNEILASSSYPAVLDPVVSAEISLTGAVSGSSTYSEETPALSFDGTSYLAVWADNRDGTGYDIYAARANTAIPPNVLDSASIPIAGGDGDQIQPSVAFNGSAYLVVWADRASGDLDVLGQRVDAVGALVGGPITIASAAGDQASPTVASAGGDWVVVWHDARSGTAAIYAARVDATGTIVDPPFALAPTGSQQRDPAVACGPINCLAAWADGASGLEDVKAARFSPGAVVLDAPSLLVAGPGQGRQLLPAVAFDGTTYLVVWQDYRLGTYDIRGNRVDGATGSALDAASILISGAAGQQQSPAIAYDGSQYLVAWHDDRAGTQDLYGARVQVDGSVSDPAGIGMSSEPNQQSFAAVTTGGGRFFVAWQDARTGLRDIRASPVSGAGAVLVPSGSVLALAANRQLAPAVAFDGTRYVVLFADSRASGGANYDIYSVRVSLDGLTVTPPGGAAVSAAAGQQVAPDITFNGNQFLAVWQDSRNAADFDIYGARIRGNYALRDPGGRAISTATGDQAYPRVAFNNSAARFMVVWSDRRSGGWDVYRARVRSNGTVDDATGVVVSSAAGDQLRPDIASNNQSWLLAWTDRRGGANTDDVYAQRVTSGGTASPPEIAVSTAPNRQEDVRLTAAGLTYFAAWSDTRTALDNADVYGARISSAGLLQDPVGIGLATTAVGESRPDVAVVGSSYFVVWRQQLIAGSVRHNIYGRRFSLTGAPIEGAPFAISTETGEEDQPAIVGASATQALVTYQRFDSNPTYQSERLRLRTIQFP